MEPSKEAISVRVSRLNSQLLGKGTSAQNRIKPTITREGLLDALTILYDECNTDAIKRSDKYIAQFVDKFRTTISEIKKLRVNISDFEVKNVIGRGHFGEVHVIREKQTGDVYAMKTIRKSDSLNHQSASYEEERDIMSVTQSPWLTSLQYAFQDSAHLYLVMEFHSGGDLYGLLDRQGGTLIESHATFYISELVQAIHAIHSMGYVHRDVKPDNVLLDRCGHLKLADFGSAAKLGPNGTVSDKDVISVGTPDYVAPEVLQSNDKSKNKKVTYGNGCDYWSLGVLAYEITIGNTPFNEPTVSATYNKIMNHSTHLKFSSDVSLSSVYINLIKGLITDQNSRLGYKQILDHVLFKETDWTNLRDQVPPFVPKVNGVDDTSNFLDVETKKSTPSMDNFKSKTQFSGRNLPFIGFTYVQDIPDDMCNSSIMIKKNDESLLENKKKQVENLHKRLAKVEHSSKEYDTLEKKFEESNRKLESVENVRNGLEKELASSIAETAALRRTLDLERRERKELESRALELIKSAKLKWECAEKERVAKLNEQIEKQNTRITDLCTNSNELTSKLERYKSLLDQAEGELNRMRNLQSEHKDSLAKARALSRRSVAGVENRLERMTTETQTQISDLQSKLSAALENKNHLESQLDSYRKREQDLEDQNNLSTELCNNLKKHLDTTSHRCKELEEEVAHLKNDMKNIDSLKIELEKCTTEIDKLRNDNKCIRLEEALKHEKDECRLLKKQLKDLSESLNESLAAREASSHKREVKRESDLQTLQNHLKLATEERELLNQKLQEAYNKELSNQIKVQGLEQLLSRLESGVTKLESTSDRETVLQEQVKRLEDQIKELHEKSALEKQELRTANTSLWRKEKELSNCELDKRIVERELKTSEEKVKKMEEDIKKLNSNISEQKHSHEELLNEAKESNESLLLKVEALEKAIIDLEEKCKSYKENYENEITKVGQVKKDLSVALQTVENFKNQFEVEIKTKKILEREIQNVKENNVKLHRNMDISRKHESDVSNELEYYKRDLENAQLNINVLRDACTLLENQLEEYEHLITAHESKESKLDDTILQLNTDLSSTMVEIQEAKRTLNEERSLKLLAETKCKHLQEDVDLLNRECCSYKDQVLEYKDMCTQLSDDLTVSEDRCSELETSLRALDRQLDSLKEENISLKEESTQRLTHIHQIRESNYKLNQELLDCKEENSTLSAKLSELEESLNEQNNYYKQRELKSDATIQQQTKLIDFLQSKIEDGKKKKTLSDKLFGSSKKENLPPSLTLNYRDLESMLSKERESNKNLKEQIQKLKSETLLSSKFESEHCVKSSTPPNSPRTKLALEQLVRSPASQNGEFQRKPSVQRMHHNIPHRFETRLCKKSSKCAGCSESLQLGRSVSTCSECSLSSHPRCTPRVPRTCGLPTEYAKHFKRTFSESSTRSPKNSEKTNETPQSIAVESWLKIPSRGKGGWDKKYGRLEDSMLAIYEQKPTSNMAPVSTVELCPQDGWSSVCDDVQPQDAGNTAATDLPFIIRIDVHPKTTCWPPSTQLLMTLNASEKEKWINALNDLFQRKYPELSRNTYKSIIKFTISLEIVCLQELNKEVMLFGCEEGLFSSMQGNPVLNILGPTNVQQIGVIKSVNTVMMIAGENRSLLRCELRQLESLARCAPCTNPTLNSSIVNINNRDGFHMFQLSDFRKTNIVCAATSKQLFIIKYELETNEFLPLRVLDTAEPCSCILFNEHSVIVGANKFFEIDLKTFSADEFLDASDHKLKHAVNCYKLGSYPVAIMLINDNPIEYLICFSEFGIFVDEYGRKNRENDLKWSHLPLAFSYCAPFLYVVQFAAVEIIRIAPETYDDVSLQNWICPDSVRLEFTKPKFLGANKKGIYLFVKNEVIFVNGKSVCGDDSLSDLESLAIDSEQDGSDAGTEFSFTSSMVNSLDRMSSEGESDRKVQFSSHSDL